MPYAAHDTISTDPLENGIYITEIQYAEALNGMLDGKLIRIVNGELSIQDPPPPPEPEIEVPSETD